MASLQYVCLKGHRIKSLEDVEGTMFVFLYYGLGWFVMYWIDLWLKIAITGVCQRAQFLFSLTWIYLAHIILSPLVTQNICNYSLPKGTIFFFISRGFDWLGSWLELAINRVCQREQFLFGLTWIRLARLVTQTHCNWIVPKGHNFCLV